MKTQISQQRTSVVAVQPQPTSQKEGCMKNQRSTTLKLAILAAMVITMALSAVGQQEEVVGGPGSTYQNPMQIALKEWYPANVSASVTGLYPGGASLSGSGAVVFDGANLWVEHIVAGGPNKIDKLQASDGKFIASYTVGGASTDAIPAAFDGINVWASDHSPSSRTVYRVRAADGFTTACSIGSATYPSSMAFDGTSVWVSTNNGSVVKLNPNTCAVQCTASSLGSRIYGLAYDGTNMWATAVDSSQIIKLNSSCSATHYSGPNGPIGIAFATTTSGPAPSAGRPSTVTATAPPFSLISRGSPASAAASIS